MITLKHVGDFYEATGPDAAVLAKALGLVLTQRRDGTPLCAFPCHAAADCFADLIYREVDVRIEGGL